VNLEPPHYGESLKGLAICIMTKYWGAGEVKTRLARAIGNEIAALIHREMTLFLCESLANCGNHRILNLSPPNQATKVEQILSRVNMQDRWEIEDQGSGDLGTRMLNWFDRHAKLNENSTRIAIMIGADCPLLNATHIESAAQKLKNAEVVLGPARDGGYYLIGLRSSLRDEVRQALFTKMRWSTQSVLTETRQRLERHGIQWAEIKQEEDIDTIFDLRRLLILLKNAKHSTSFTSDHHRQNLLYLRLQSIISNCSPSAKSLIYDQQNQL